MYYSASRQTMRKRFRVAPEILAEMFRTPKEPLIATGFPMDGQIVNASFCDGTVEFTVESAAFTNDSDLVVLFES